jgi:hypothetical protein
MHLYSQLIQAETGDVIKQTLRCNQVVTDRGEYAAIISVLGTEAIIGRNLLTLPISEFGVCSCGFLVYPP